MISFKNFTHALWYACTLNAINNNVVVQGYMFDKWLAIIFQVTSKMLIHISNTAGYCISFLR